MTELHELDRILRGVADDSFDDDVPSQADGHVGHLRSCNRSDYGHENVGINTSVG